MHYIDTGDKIHVGVEHVKELKGEEQAKSLAWLLGYTSHVITDVTLHPVVELKVGPYENNQRQHRRCEMHQDVYIYDHLEVGAIHSGNFLKNGISTCTAPNTCSDLDPAICETWRAILKTTDPDRYQHNMPDFSSWHRGFCSLVSKAAPGSFLVFSRHLLGETGLVYPAKCGREYSHGLDVPGGKQMDYKDIFAKAQSNVRRYWEKIVRACLTNESVDLSGLCNWNLDTGRDSAGVLAFWEE